MAKAGTTNGVDICKTLNLMAVKLELGDEQMIK